MMYAYFCVLGFIFIVILSNLFRYAYEIFSHNDKLKYICSFNDSIYEQIKAFAIPFLLWSLIEVFFLGQNNNFLFSQILGLFVGVCLLYIIDCMCMILNNKKYTIINITSNIASSILSCLIAYFILNVKTIINVPIYISIIVLILLIIAIILLSINPPLNEMFKDPITDEYGISGHNCKHEN